MTTFSAFATFFAEDLRDRVGEALCSVLFGANKGSTVQGDHTHIQVTVSSLQVQTQSDQIRCVLRHISARTGSQIAEHSHHRYTQAGPQRVHKSEHRSQHNKQARTEAGQAYYFALIFPKEWDQAHRRFQANGVRVGRWAGKKSSRGLTRR